MSSDRRRQSELPSGSRVGPTDIRLLENTQKYLQALLDRQAPDSVAHEAWQEFYRVYTKLIRRFAIARGVRDADADDCVQEVWSEVATRLTDFQRPENRSGLRAWLYTLVRSKATDLVRRNASRPAQNLGSAIRDVPEPGADEADPAALLDQQWEQAMLETVLDELQSQVSEVNYRLLYMRLIEGRDVQEVAATLKLTLAQVRYRQHRTLRKLRANLAVYTGKPFGPEND